MKASQARKGLITLFGSLSGEGAVLHARRHPLGCEVLLEWAGTVSLRAPSMPRPRPPPPSAANPALPAAAHPALAPTLLCIVQLPPTGPHDASHDCAVQRVRHFHVQGGCWQLELVCAPSQCSEHVPVSARNTCQSALGACASQCWEHAHGAAADGHNWAAPDGSARCRGCNTSRTGRGPCNAAIRAASTLRGHACSRLFIGRHLGSRLCIAPPAGHQVQHPHGGCAGGELLGHQDLPVRASQLNTCFTF